MTRFTVSRDQQAAVYEDADGKVTRLIAEEPPGCLCACDMCFGFARCACFFPFPRLCCGDSRRDGRYIAWKEAPQ